MTLFQSSLGGVNVLDELTFSVYKGDFLGIVGPEWRGQDNAAQGDAWSGKTVRRQSHVFGRDPGSSPGRIGYVPQRIFFDRDFPISVLDLVLMGRLSKKKLFQHYNSADREKADSAIRTAGLERLRERRIGALSGGELQRALIARALAGEPELLLLDEPTASVDPQMKTTIYDLLDQLKEKLTIILVSHDTGTISRHVNRIACLNGKLDMLEGSSPGRKKLEELYRYPVDVIVQGEPISQTHEPR